LELFACLDGHGARQRIFHKFGTYCDGLFHSWIRDVPSIPDLNLSFNPPKDHMLIRIANATLLNTLII
jgi:hypothetical protein